MPEHGATVTVEGYGEVEFGGIDGEAETVTLSYNGMWRGHDFSKLGRGVFRIDLDEWEERHVEDGGNVSTEKRDAMFDEVYGDREPVSLTGDENFEEEFGEEWSEWRYGSTGE